MIKVIQENGNYIEYSRISAIDFHKDGIIIMGMPKKDKDSLDLGEGLCFDKFLYDFCPIIRIEFKT